MRLYFGFGANSRLEMIRAITGRGAVSVPARLDGFALCIESFQNIAKKAQKILVQHWDTHFVSYGIIRKSKGSLNGRLWLLTNAQHEAIKQWELTGVWSHEVPVTASVRILGIPFSVPAKSEEPRHQNVQIVCGDSYPLFIVPKEKILSVATLVRQTTS